MSTTLLEKPPVKPHKVAAAPSTLSPRQLAAALPGALRGLDPRRLWDSPVMFVVEVGAAFTTVLAVVEPSAFAWSIAVWLWLTVVFATLAESVAEGRGKAQAASLRATQRETTARKVVGIHDDRPRCPRRRCRSATSWSSSPGRPSPATAT